MLTSIQSAGVPSEVNLKPRADITRSPKQGYQWPHEKDYVVQKFILKKIEYEYLEQDLN